MKIKELESAVKLYGFDYTTMHPQAIYNDLCELLTFKQFGKMQDKTFCGKYFDKFNFILKLTKNKKIQALCILGLQACHERKMI